MHTNKKLITNTHSQHIFYIYLLLFSKAVIIITIRSYNPIEPPAPNFPKKLKQQKYTLTHTNTNNYNYTLLQ